MDIPPEIHDSFPLHQRIIQGRRQLLTVDDAHEFINNLTALEDEDGRNCADPERCRHLGRVVGIEFTHLDFAVVLGRQLLDRRGDHLTGTAPGCPKIDQNRSCGFNNICLKILIRKGCDITGHGNPL